jgi:hypothetical protein
MAIAATRPWLWAVSLAFALQGGLAKAEIVQVEISTKTAVASFRSNEAFGAGLDGSGAGDTDRLYTAHNVQAMRSAGLPRITYRLRTELGIEVWHWGPQGAWSDPAKSQGYWTSSDRQDKPVLTSYGYQLPRRGDTIDQANNAGYSRLDDGDLQSFWKSNPYLDPSYTGEAAPRPQWVIIEFDDVQAIDMAQIVWADPYAAAFTVQYWVGVDEYDPAGRWIDFPGGGVTDAHGGETDLALAPSAIHTQFVRLLLKTSSGTAPPGSNDPRDAMGFAIREVRLGARGVDGRFVDAIQRGATRTTQTLMHVSSTDPWHRAQDLDRDLEQPGLDRVYRSGLTNGLPMMVPVGVLYDTPENAAAEIGFLKGRGYRFAQVELGEEPDGQYVDAADYGALYLQVEKAVHAIDPKLVTGGPSLENGVSDTWLDPNPDRSWTSQLMTYLRARGRLDALGFFSFERYPFDDVCGDLHPKLIQQTQMMSDLFVRLKADGVPTVIPWIITEYGFSAFSGRAMVEMPSALLMADIVGQFLSLGGHAAYMFGYGPNIPINQHLDCAGYGNMMLQLADARGQAGARLPSYYAARLLTQTWAQPGDGLNRIFPLNVAGAGDSLTAYALLRPDGDWSVLLVNRDPAHILPVNLRFRGPNGAPVVFSGPIEAFKYSSADYRWAPDGLRGRPSRDKPPRRLELRDPAAPISLEPDSLTVLRGKGPSPGGA